ncbi:MAG: lysophospholipid acyltransferase family protein [Planctomycetota bacterium]|jgi:1-acyl-sn-glycerol-3-phosphate acyltransferase
MAADAGGLIPEDPSPRFIAFFGWYARRLVRRRFNALRIDRPGADALRALDELEGPMIVLLNHASWWDPLTVLVISRSLLPGRTGCAPMDREQLQRFRFMRRLGVFGIDPDDPASLAVMRDHVLRHFRSGQRPTLALTPQGRFADVREPVELRPGAAAIAAAADSCEVVSLALEYVFWQDARPEVLVRVQRCRPERTSTTGWQRAMQRAMRENAAALAVMAMERDAAAFVTLEGKRSGRINPIYDLLLKVRGRSGPIAAQRGREGR